MTLYSEQEALALGAKISINPNMLINLENAGKPNALVNISTT